MRVAPRGSCARPRFSLAARVRPFAALAITLLLFPALTRAQVVRGSVSQETSGTPIVGALIELLFADSADVRAASALSGLSGDFELRAPGAGRFRISAKRIGVKRFEGAPFALEAGETRREAIVLAPIDYRLPEVLVTASGLCTVRDDERGRVASLWEEARTALDATEISLRDKLFSAEVTRFVRELDPKTLRVLNESRSRVRGVVASPFNSLPAESLSVVGYWRASSEGGTQYFGPDARVLLSDTFLDEHCFRTVTGRAERQGLSGLAFSPVSDRGVPDVHGTLWLDGRTSELRLLEFRYDRVREGVDSAAVGGEVHFARLPNGAWLVSRWSLRVPSLGRPAQPLSTEGSAPWLLVRPSLSALREEGGVVVTDDMRAPARVASVAGVVKDSSGARGLPGATVRIGGGERARTTDAEGRFAFDSLAPGSVTFVVSADGYDALGLTAADVAVELGDGEQRRLTLTAHDARALTTRLCAGREAPWGRGTVHAAIRDASTGAPIAGVKATLGWMSTVGRAAGDSTSQDAAGVSDARGHLTFCEVPSGRELTLRVTTAAEPVILRTTINAREVRHVEVTIPARSPNE